MRLRKALRASDLVARLGGDEFAIIQSRVTSKERAEQLAARLVEDLNRPFELPGQTIEVGASIGVALAPADGANAEEILRNADMALYRAKAEGRGRYVVFQAELNSSIKDRRRLASDLKNAIHASEFELHYQPIVSLADRRVTTLEALLRWRHPARGMIAPGIFVPLAEESGVMACLGEWALNRACAEAVRWPDDVKVAVNLSAVQFQSGDLYKAVADAVERSGLPANRLELEVTERILLQEESKALDVLRKLRNLGVSIAFDDFGAGAASLTHLRSFSFDRIKIDRSVVRDLPARSEGVALVRAVAHLAHMLGMKMVAEGVETAEHLELVAGAGCDEVQGIFSASPRRARK